MKSLITILVILFATQLLSAQSFSPEVLCNASGKISNGVTNIDWTLGETIILTSQTTNNILSSGFGQPSYIVTAITNHIVDYGIQLFPNPVKEILVLQVNDTKLQHAFYQLFDILGKEIFNGIIINNITSINCSQLTSSMYWLRISDASNQPIQTFKIVKN